MNVNTNILLEWYDVDDHIHSLIREIVQQITDEGLLDKIGVKELNIQYATAHPANKSFLYGICGGYYIKDSKSSTQIGIMVNNIKEFAEGKEKTIWQTLREIILHELGHAHLDILGYCPQNEYYADMFYQTYNKYKKMPPLPQPDWCSQQGTCSNCSRYNECADYE